MLLLVELYFCELTVKRLSILHRLFCVCQAFSLNIHVIERHLIPAYSMYNRKVYFPYISAYRVTPFLTFNVHLSKVPKVQSWRMSSLACGGHTENKMCDEAYVNLSELCALQSLISHIP